MSGIGRRTQYRKHLTDSVLFDSPEPKSNELIAKVMATRGSNQFDVQLAQPSTSIDESANEHGASEHSTIDSQRGENTSETVLAILPTKFRTLVWVKRNDFVIVQCADPIDDTDNGQSEGTSSGGGIRYMISHILYKDQIHHLQTKGLWPVHDPDFASWSSKTAAPTSNVQEDEANNDGIVYAYAEEEEVFSDDEGGNKNDDLLFVNTNRVANLALDESSDDE